MYFFVSIMKIFLYIGYVYGYDVYMVGKVEMCEENHTV